MTRPLLTHLRATARDAIHPTALALLWLALLILFRKVCMAQIPTWPARARSSLDASYLTGEATEERYNVDRLWMHLEWASYRIIASLSPVTGLLLAFRSNSAIERWSTARRKWSDVQATSRSLLRLLSASLLPHSTTETVPDAASVRDFAEKQEKRRNAEATLATIPFFSISLMCEMRGLVLHLSPGREQSLLRTDLVEMLPPALIALAKRHHGEDPTQANGCDTASNQEKRKQLKNLNSPHVIKDSTHSTHTSTNSNLALISLVLLQQSLDTLHSRSQLTSPVYAHSIGLLNSLSTHMTELERVRDTPIPLSVSTHFSRLLMIHSCLLPVVVVQKLKGERWWLCALVVGVVTSMLYGVDSFAAKLGQPMGLDREDLPLEKYVADAQNEWQEVMSAILSIP
ncbi:hypothetical protein EX895_005912 [Sporisorium graminicola]|uniref:Uncharacterized protein n=1 Tax=Sporisorium graminicola TaxID=280036 RepID=A0A4U7KPD8_9BASI|nr:hypothetical protein EX895_005912 [Sporisorium graminicola]TKY84832.1 hypothetical protein EX895_005912 [Sporisorium graminicola]